MLKSFLYFLAGFALTFITSAAHAAEVISSQPPISNHTRTLAASCAACHGTNGNSVSSSTTPSLAGINSIYFVTQMSAFKSGERSALVMQHNAKGITVDEVNLLGLYFSQQKRLTAIGPKSQALKADHD